MKPSQLKAIAWSLSGITTLIAVIAWGQDLGWNFTSISGYQWFPVLGLTAFSLMWAHYIVGALHRIFNIDFEISKQYFEITGWIVLVAILLHPGILILQLFKDGYGLPPNSYVEVYGAGGMKLALMLGSVSLVAFLIFELKRKFEDASWWKYVVYLNDLAIVAIFYHGLSLGGQLQGGWYRALWYFYGVTLVAAIGYSRFGKFIWKERQGGRQA